MMEEMRSGEIQRKFGLLALGLLVAIPGLAKADVKFNFNTIDVTDVTLCDGSCQRTAVNGNNNNVMVGEFDDAMGNTHGFILRGGVGGEYTQIDVPGAISTSVNGINASGRLSGTYQDKKGVHAFFFSGGTFTTLDYPGASLTQSGFINAQGQVVGTYRTPSDNKRHGFIWQSGDFTSFDVPSDDPVLGTGAWGINDRDR
jgi:uncharacterized membrane protein